MTRILVWRDLQGDWVMDCTWHETRKFCADWELAYESAAGHAAMHHPRVDDRGENDADPYDRPVRVEGRYPHNHSEPVCASPWCETYLTRDQMAELHRRQGAP